jgi:hypothetical protein
MHCRRLRCRSRSWRRKGGSPLRGLRGGFFRRSFGFGGGFRVGGPLQMTLHLFSDIGRDRTRVRFLFGYAKARQKVNDGFRLDLQLARQLVDADLGCVTHAS